MVEGRVFRRVDERWTPVGEPLPVWDHAPPRPRQDIAVWILPQGEGYQVGDVVAFGEIGHRLLSTVPTDDPAWSEVIDAALATNEPVHVREWVNTIDLWLGMRLQSGWRM